MELFEAGELIGSDGAPAVAIRLLKLAFQVEYAIHVVVLPSQNILYYIEGRVVQRLIISQWQIESLQTRLSTGSKITVLTRYLA